MTPQASEVALDIAPEEAVCYYCKAPLGAETTVCLSCGHRQYRVCYCGERIQPNLATCPHCEADWSESSRVKSRRKSRTHGSVRGLLRSSITGAITFAVLSGVLYLAGGRAAQGLGVAEPASMSARLWYLGQAIANSASILGDRLFGMISGKHVLQAVALLLTGAALGALWYLVRHSRWIGVKLGVRKTRRHRRAA